LIAWLCTQRQVHVTDGDATFSPTEAPAMASWHDARGALHAWPTFSPDGKNITCFRVTDPQGQGSQVLVTDPAGVRQVHLAELRDEMPVYLSWSPDGSMVGWLTQASDRLVAYCAASDGTGPVHTVIDGRPLFFTWMKNQVAAYVGSLAPDSPADAPRLLVLSPGQKDAVAVHAHPERFCMPINVGYHLIYVARHGPQNHVVRTHIHTRQTQPIGEAVDHGDLTGIVINPSRTRIARAGAPSGEGAPYHDLVIHDLESNTWRNTGVPRCVAFTWCGDDKLIAYVDEPRSEMVRIVVVNETDTQVLTRFRPSREYTFYLRFFEQFTSSHPVTSPDGTRLLLAGLPAYSGDVQVSHLWEVDIVSGKVNDIDEGVFGVYAPDRSTA
jgi:hypothetical protein